MAPRTNLKIKPISPIDAKPSRAPSPAPLPSGLTAHEVIDLASHETADEQAFMRVRVRLAMEALLAAGVRIDMMRYKTIRALSEDWYRSQGIPEGEMPKKRSWDRYQASIKREVLDAARERGER